MINVIPYQEKVILILIEMIFPLMMQPGNYPPCISYNDYFVQEGTRYILHRVSLVFFCQIDGQLDSLFHSFYENISGCCIAISLLIIMILQLVKCNINFLVF